MPAPPDLSSLRIDDGARRRRGSPRRLVLVLVLGVALVAALAAAYALFGRTPAVRVAAARAAPGGGEQALLQASGYVTPRRRATVAAKITGRVAEVYAEEGMRVEPGQVLARLDDTEARSRLAAAETQRDVAAAARRDLEVNLANAERELARARELRASGFESQKALDDAATAVDSLRARLDLAREQLRSAEANVRVARDELDNCTVRAPFAGIVVSKDAQRGEMVSPISAGGGFTRTGIATIVDMGSLEIEVDVNESHIAKIRPGQRVTAVLDAYPDWRIPAAVRTVIPTADRQKATVKVRIALAEDVLFDPRLLPDMGVKVSFLADEQAGAAARAARALVPKAALRQVGGKSMVAVVRDGRVEMRTVTAGAELGSDVEMLAGVSEGEAVVVEGPELRDGQPVRVE